MTSENGLLQRSKSFLLRRKASKEQHNAREEELLPCRPVKHQYVIAQVVRDDSHITPYLGQATTVPLPARQISQRQTWPASPKERKPGSFVFEEAPVLTSTPWELERKRRPQSQWSRRTTKPQVFPAHIFEQLPHEIYNCIVDHLEAIYQTQPTYDRLDLQHELHSLCQVSRRWAKVAIEHLYRDLWLPSNATPLKRKLSSARGKSRLELLSRTLSEAPGLAWLVRRIQVNSALRSQLYGSGTSELQRDGTRKLLRDVISCCSELEAVTGYSPPLGYDRDYHVALLHSSRLASHVWLLCDHALDASFSPGRFLDLHNRWQWLDTLVLARYQQPSLGPGIISGITSRLWSLQHLVLYGFSREDCHNGTLLSLPPLKSLRLERLEGITDQGVEQLATSRLAFSLESLSLVSLDILSVRTLQALLGQLPRLRRFRLVQDSCPSLLVGSDYTNKRSRLGSTTLRYLHWDTLVPGAAIVALAESVRQGCFPALRTIKAPSDYDGHLQALCRPVVQQNLPFDDVVFLASLNDHYTRSLRLAQIQAQLRIKETKQRPSMNLVVDDTEAHVQHTHIIGSFLGDVHSQIEYSLEPDVKGSGNALASLADILAPAAPMRMDERNVTFRDFF